MERTRLKILLSAYACSPHEGSEAGVGWLYAKALSRYHDIWILTEQNRYEEPVRTLVHDNAHLRTRINVIGVKRRRSRAEKVWSHLYYLTYNEWQREAYRVAKEVDSQIDFDVVHQLTLVGYREPGYLWKLDKPFVWGPIGGHAQMPCRYLPSLGISGMCYYGLRNAMNYVQMRASNRVRQAIKHADVLIAATNVDREAIGKIHGRNSVLISEVGTTIEEHEPNSRRDKTIRLVWCGLLIPRKSLQLALRAVALAKEQIPLELHIVGGGSHKTMYMKLAEKLGIADQCVWHGVVPHPLALSAIQNADVMLLTSLQDATSTVLMEAIQAGVPVICHNACGFSDVVQESCGITITLSDPKGSVRGFAEAIVKIGSNAKLLAALSEGARKRAADFSWEKKAEQVSDLYFLALQNHKSPNKEVVFTETHKQTDRTRS